MMAILGSPIMLALVCLFTYYAMGAYEARFEGGNQGILWAGLSALVSLLVLSVGKGDWSWLLLAQIGLYLGIAVFRAVREP
ncbi:MAG: hypothetical protein ACREPT_08365 [Rudaea sp.]